MPVSVNMRDDHSLTTVIYSGGMTADDIITSFKKIAAPEVRSATVLVDLQDCQLAMTAAEFMRVIDGWYEMLGIDVRAALVFHAEAQKDQAMLFETKSFLVGGRSKSFTSLGEAQSWLESWTAPSPGSA